MERSLLLIALCASLPCALAANANAAPAGHPATSATPAAIPPPKATPELQKVLDAMAHASTEGHPDLFGQFNGMRRLFAGDYAEALKYFRRGARYADKPSQLSIGLMHMNGRGVAKDPALACAWISLAAERGYPNYLRARDAVCNALSAPQHQRAMAELDKLRPEYGDAAAKPRMALALREARSNMTGSRTGHDFGVSVVAPDGVNCNADVLYLGTVPVPREGCGRYDPKLSDPKAYFAARDTQLQGKVTVGELRPVDAPKNGKPAKPGG